MPRKKQNKPEQFSNILSKIPVQFQSQVPKLSFVAQQLKRPSEAPFDANLDNEIAAIERLENNDPAVIENPGKDNNIDFELFLRILNKLSGQVRIIFEMQLIWSLRCCEALDIRNQNILPNGLIFITGHKGSNGRFIFCPDVLSLMNHSKTYANYRVFVISYTAYYNNLKKHGINFKRGKNSKFNCVTHSLRKFNIQAIQNSTGATIKELLSYTGHKSISGLNYYLGRNSLFSKGGTNNG